MRLQSAKQNLSAIPKGSAASGDSSCRSFYSQLFQDGTLNFAVGLGYFDGSSANYQFAGKEYPDIVLDPYAYNAFINVLRTKCKGTNSQVCGFQISNGVLAKKIRASFGRDVTVNIRIANGGASPDNKQNASPSGKMTSAQAKKSENARRVFFGGIQKGAEVAIYMGHARSGGGPDFYPPRLLANGHVDYGYYKAQREGISTLLGVLQQAAAAGQSPKVVALLACKSSGLFASSVSKYSPGSMIISAKDLFNDRDIFPTGLAVMDALMSERCESAFVRSIKISPESASQLSINYTP